MRIFYKIWMSENHKNADILSFAFCSDKGNKLYVEANDVSPLNMSAWHQENIYLNLLGKKGIKTIVPEFPKLVAAICSIESGREKLSDFLEQYKFIEFVGHSDYYEIQALLWLMEWELESRHINLINIADNLLEKHSDCFDAIKGDLPDKNALRMALGFKYMSTKINRGGRK